MKKRLILILIVLLAVMAFWSCKENKPGSPDNKGEKLSKDASYAIGMNIGASLIADGIYPTMGDFLKGLEDQLTGKKLRFTEEEAMEKFQEAYYAMMERKEAEVIAKENEFLAENSKKPGVIVTSSGLQYEVITETNRQKPVATDIIRVHYEGKLTNGDVFDSTHSHEEPAYEEPAEFQLNRVIPGWIEGLQLMGVGSKYIFYIPSNLAYGSNSGGPIPPYSTLIFEVELLDIINQ